MTVTTAQPSLTRLAAGVLAVALCLAALAFAAAPASAASVAGTVVQVNERADTFVVAQADGTLASVHSSPRPRVGWVVKVDARQLANGTWAARHVSVQIARRWASARRSSVHAAARRWASQKGATRHKLARRWASVTDVRHRKLARRWAAVKRAGTKVQGTVTFVDRKRGAMTVSATGVSVPVHLGTPGAASAAAATPVAVGDVVTVDTGVTRTGHLVEHTTTDLGPDIDGIELEALVQRVDAATRTVFVSPKGTVTSSELVPVAIPDDVSVDRYRVGKVMDWTVLPQSAPAPPADPGTPAPLAAPGPGFDMLRSTPNDSVTLADDPKKGLGMTPDQAQQHAVELAPPGAQQPVVPATGRKRPVRRPPVRPGTQGPGRGGTTPVSPGYPRPGGGTQGPSGGRAPGSQNPSGGRAPSGPGEHTHGGGRPNDPPVPATPAPKPGHKQGTPPPKPTPKPGGGTQGWTPPRTATPPPARTPAPTPPKPPAPQVAPVRPQPAPGGNRRHGPRVTDSAHRTHRAR